jgi:hypothetical protein
MNPVPGEAELSPPFARGTGDAMNAIAPKADPELLVQVIAKPPDVVQSPLSSPLLIAPVVVVTRVKPVPNDPDKRNPVVAPACKSTMAEADPATVWPEYVRSATHPKFPELLY